MSLPEATHERKKKEKKKLLTLNMQHETLHTMIQYNRTAAPNKQRPFGTCAAGANYR